MGHHGHQSLFLSLPQWNEMLLWHCSIIFNTCPYGRINNKLVQILAEQPLQKKLVFTCMCIKMDQRRSQHLDICMKNNLYS